MAEQLKGLTAQDAFCCIGTTIAEAGSQEAFREADVDAVLLFARGGARRRATRFVVVSSVGADSRSKKFYLRTKGEMEDAVTAVGFPSVDILQPSLLLGPRKQARPMETGRQIVRAADQPAADRLARSLARDSGRDGGPRDDSARRGAAPAASTATPTRRSGSLPSSGRRRPWRNQSRQKGPCLTRCSRIRDAARICRDRAFRKVRSCKECFIDVAGMQRTHGSWMSGNPYNSVLRSGLTRRLWLIIALAMLIPVGLAFSRAGSRPKSAAPRLQNQELTALSREQGVDAAVQRRRRARRISRADSKAATWWCSMARRGALQQHARCPTNCVQLVRTAARRTPSMRRAAPRILAWYASGREWRGAMTYVPPRDADDAVGHSTVVVFAPEPAFGATFTELCADDAGPARRWCCCRRSRSAAAHRRTLPAAAARAASRAGRACASAASKPCRGSATQEFAPLEREFNHHVAVPAARLARLRSARRSGSRACSRPARSIARSTSCCPSSAS